MWALLIGLTVLLLFFRAFSLPYFADDYFFLTKTSVHSYTDILNWFNPLRGEFFRPLSSEVFYGLTRYTPPFFAHCIVFGVFFIGLFLLYKIVARHISSRVGLLSVFLYAVHFSHVYRLYWLATFQEVLMVTFLLLSFFQRL